MSAGNLGELRGGAKYFFSGPKCPPSFSGRNSELHCRADADLIPVPGRLELHGRCRCGVCCLHALVLYLSQI